MMMTVGQRKNGQHSRETGCWYFSTLWTDKNWLTLLWSRFSWLLFFYYLRSTEELHSNNFNSIFLLSHHFTIAAPPHHLCCCWPATASADYLCKCTERECGMICQKLDSSQISVTLSLEYVFETTLSSTQKWKSSRLFSHLAAESTHTLRQGKGEEERAGRANIRRRRPSAFAVTLL